MVKSKPNNRAKGARRARRNPRKNVQMQNQKASMSNISLGGKQVGAVVSTRFPKLGFSDILGHRVGWILGYTFVGDGTRGTANNVFFTDAASTYLFGGLTGTAGTSGIEGGVPVVGADSKLGATYISDIEKHYARKRIRKMVLTVVSLQPSTSNNMMAVISPARGSGVAAAGITVPKATATAVQQIFTNVMSMDDAMTVDSFETKSMDITKYIAGGSGAAQNEFEIQNYGLGATVLQPAAGPIDLEGLVPASIVVSGNSTTAGLQNTNVHAIVITQFIDFIDFIGGSVLPEPVGVAAPAVKVESVLPTTLEIAKAREILERVAALPL